VIYTVQQALPLLGEGASIILLSFGSAPVGTTPL
jgi:hypothetical protein